MYVSGYWRLPRIGRSISGVGKGRAVCATIGKQRGLPIETTTHLESTAHSVKSPPTVRTLISSALFGLMALGNVISQWYGQKNIALFSGFATMFLLFATLFFWLLFRTFKKPTELRLSGGTIRINGREIRAEDIKAIMSSGHWTPVIGIKPNGKKVVPLDLCFRFAMNEEQGIADIEHWAEANGVKLVKGAHFPRWL